MNSKTSAPGETGEYDFYYRGDQVGIDVVGDLVDTAEMRGYVERTGAWYQLEDGTKLQGRDSFVDKVKEDDKLRAMLEKKLNE